MGRGEASEPWRRAQQQECRGQSGEIPAQGIGANQHSPAWEACLLTCWDGWGLGAEARASEVRSQGEDWGWLPEHSLKGVSAPQLAGRESGKKSGAAKEARDHCDRVHEERGFLPCLPTESRAPLKQAAETSTSCGYQLGPQRPAWIVNAATAANKNPMCKQACPAFCTPPSPQPEWARAPSSAASWTPSCLGGKQTPGGDLHEEVGPKPKLNPRSCANKKEKGKSLPAASGAVD